MAEPSIVLGETSTAWVNVKVPVKMDNGKTHHISFQAHLLRPTKTRIKEVLKDISDAESDFINADIVSEMLKGWRKVKGISLPDGSEPDFHNDDHRELMLDFIGVEAGIVNAFFDFIAGGRAKNS